ncbi:hypothetical protein KCU65_g1268, partial [Aureobasidium melanogenum]
MNISAKLSAPAKSSKLTTKEENRLNEAAKIRVAKLLGVKRNMIDLTDDEPPRKQARIDSHGHMEVRAPATAPCPAPQNGMGGSVSHEAPIQAPNAYANPPMAQTQMRRPSASVPQPTQLAHPPDMLDHISMAVASLETFQLREILSTAALRHPDILDLLRTTFRIQETHKSTAHQAIYDLLVSQSQEEARIVRLRDEQVRRDSASRSGPYGPPLDANGAPLTTYGGIPPVAPYRPAWGPEYYTAAQPTTTPKPTFRAPPGLQQHEQATTPAAQPPAPALPSQISDFHARIHRLSGPLGYMTDGTKLDALKTLCNSAIEFVKNADTTIKGHLRNDKVFTEACWRIYDTLDERSRVGLLHPIRLRDALDKLEKMRDGCFVGLEEFFEAFRKNSIPEWKEGVRGLDDEDDEDVDSLPDQSDSYNSMDEEEEDDDF